MARVSRRARTVLVAASCIVLAGYYSLLTYLALNPAVSDGYRRYYIERSTPLTPFEQAKVANGLGEPVVRIAYDDAHARFTGWSLPEDGFRWNEGQSASLDFQVPTTANLRGVLLLSVIYVRHEARSVRLRLNGVTIGSYNSRRDPWDMLVHIDPSLLKPGQVNALSFEFPDARLPENGDPRRLAMALQAVELY